jgi:hypothetical protein
MAFTPSPIMSKEGYKMQEPRCEFPSHLPPNTSKYKYSGFAGLENAVSQAYDRFIDNNQSLVVFTDIPPEEIEKYSDSFPGRIDYYPILQMLVLSMVSYPHEVATGTFEQLMTVKATKNGIRRILTARGATRTKTPSREKQADRSWSPSPPLLPPGRSIDWPTVPLEVAFSESRQQVKADMGWWLNASNGDVLLALSIDIKRQSKNIYVTSWERGAMPTRQHPRPDPKTRQEIIIYRDLNGQGPRVIPNVALIVPFHELMLRNPRPGESDFIFTPDDLLQIAAET